MEPEYHQADVELIMKLKDHDEQAMIIFYKTYWRSLYNSAFKILKDKEACEDIIQDLFIKVWSNRQQLNIRGSIQAYLSAAVRYEVYRKVRETKNYQPIVDEMADAFFELSVAELLEYKELQHQISSVVNTLPAKCKEVYILSRNEHLSHKEISDRLAISTKTVRNHLTRALHQLRLSVNHVLLVIISLLFFK